MSGIPFAKFYEIIRNSNYTRIVLTVAFQRFGYYGLRSLLLIYLITNYNISDTYAGQIYGIFYGSFFLTSLLGGFLGDTKFGHKKICLLGIMLMLIAQLSLGFGKINGTLIGLFIYSVGFGLFTPNVNVTVAEQYQNDENQRSAAYIILYWAINLGAMLGPVVCGYIALQTNWKYGFLSGVPFTLCGLILFAGLIKHEKQNAQNNSEAQALQSEDSHKKENLRFKQREIFLMIGILAVITLIFAAVFDQLGSSVTLLVHRHVSRDFWSFQIPAGYVQSINPFIVILFGPIVAFVVKRRAVSATPHGKVKILILGFFLLGIGFLLLSVSSMRLTDTGTQIKVSWIWIFFAVFFATFGELLFAPTSISLVALLAPKKHKGLIMGGWSATYGIGTYLSGTIAGLMSSSGHYAAFFAVSASGCLLGCLCLLIAISQARKYGSFT